MSGTGENAAAIRRLSIVEGQLSEALEAKAKAEAERDDAFEAIDYFENQEADLTAAQAKAQRFEREARRLQQERSSLQAKVNEKDPAWLQEQQQKADEAEGSRQKRTQIKNLAIYTGIVAVISAIFFGGMYLLGMHWVWAISLGTTAVILTPLFPSIMDFCKKLWPKVVEHQVGLTIAAGVLFGLTMAVIGAMEIAEMVTTGSTILACIFSFFGYGLLMWSFLMTLVKVLSAEEPTSKEEKRRLYLQGYYLILVIVGTLIAVTTQALPPFFEAYFAQVLLNHGTAGFLVSLFTSLVYGSIVMAIAAALAWGGTKVLKHVLGGLKTKKTMRKHLPDAGLRFCQALLGINSIVIGVTVGNALWPRVEANLKQYLIAATIAALAAIIFLFLDGTLLKTVYNKEYEEGKSLRGWIGITFAVACVTAFFTFSSVYEFVSGPTRFSATKSEVTAGMEEFRTSVKDRANTVGKSGTNQRKESILEAVALVDQGIEMANNAKDRKTLNESLVVFHSGADVLVGIAKKEDREDVADQLASIHIPDVSSPMQLVLGTGGDNAEKHPKEFGDIAVSALVTLWVDFLILLVITFLRNRPRRKENVIGSINTEDEAVCQVVTAMDDGACIIDRGVAHLIELGWTFTAFNLRGKPLGSMRVTELLGERGAKCQVIREDGSTSADLTDAHYAQLIS